VLSPPSPSVDWEIGLRPPGLWCGLRSRKRPFACGQSKRQMRISNKAFQLAPIAINQQKAKRMHIRASPINGSWSWRAPPPTQEQRLSLPLSGSSVLPWLAIPIVQPRVSILIWRARTKDVEEKRSSHNLRRNRSNQASAGLDKVPRRANEPPLSLIAGMTSLDDGSIILLRYCPRGVLVENC
jgi:hypothetical protein